MATHPIRITVLLVVFVAVAALSASGQTFRDKERGYTVKTYPKWTAVPVEPTERYMTARWASKRGDKHGYGRMFVYVFERNSAEKAKTAEKKPDAEDKKLDPSKLSDIKKMLDARPRMRSYQEWAKRNRPKLSLGDPKPIKGRKAKGVDLTANYYEGTMPGYGDDYYVVIGVYSTPDLEYAVELLCTSKSQRKNKSKFRRIAKSLRFTTAPLTASERKAKAAQAADNPQSPREAARARARRDSRLKGWWFVESENYFIVTNVEGKKRGRVYDLKRRLEAIRKHYARDFTPIKEITAISIVRVCRDRKTYSQYGGPGGSAGYWNFVAEELVLFLQGDKDFARSVLYHEAFHQYIHYAIGGDIKPHTWFNEGYADYYAGAKLIRGRAVIQPFEWRVGTIRKHLRAGTEVPLKKILKYSKRQYYADSRRCYAEGWSIAYFLNKGLSKKHPWRRILPTYYDVLKKSQSNQKALAAAFKQVDLDAMDAAWRKFTLKGIKAKP